MTDEKLFDALKQYFHVLRNYGYVKDKEVFNLLYALFVNDFLKEYVGLVTEDDYNTISKSLTHLVRGSCLLPYESYRKHVEKMNMSIGNVRISQFNKIRSNGKHVKTAYI